MNQVNYLSTKALANKWGMSYYSLQRWRRSGFGPAYLKLGGSIRYTPEAIKAFEASPEFAKCMAYVNRKKEARS